MSPGTTRTPLDRIRQVVQERRDLAVGGALFVAEAVIGAGQVEPGPLARPDLDHLSSASASSRPPPVGRRSIRNVASATRIVTPPGAAAFLSAMGPVCQADLTSL
jgi:hypothetical protein